MGELLKEFLRQTIVNLQTLHRESLGPENLTEEFLRRSFRQLHTIKGTSNTFNLSYLAHLAHDIEDLLQALQNNQIQLTTESTALIQKSFEQLLELCQNYQEGKEIVFPQDFTDQIRAILPDSKADYQKELLYRNIPDQLLSQLSTPEKNSLNVALEGGKTFYLLEVCFNLSTFYDDFKNFKEILGQSGEVIAVAPAKAENLSKEIAFQIFYVTGLPKAEIAKTVEAFKVKSVFENYPYTPDKADNLAGMVVNLVDDAEQLALALNKEIMFMTLLDDLDISPRHLVLLNEIISHLLHNAIDHGIETVAERIEKGKTEIATIEIEVASVKNELFVQITDDGRGIDAERITELAQQKGLILFDRVLDDAEALEITFQPGFTTKEKVSEISGRGVGLDAVKDLVERSNGKIEVETISGEGTTFSIYLPQN